ncbi:ABC transporter substrate-binding protein [Nocardioides sp. Bht2]|uniref:ABC transporter substrate-binding protein n=1 Tax=Nocardioides sp. Bht2 TaxID=3392297 RepID=UPI0039B4BEE2
MRTVRGVVSAVAVLMVGGLLAACGSDDDGSVGGADRELVLALGGESAEGYDPTLGWGRYGSPLFQSTLLARNPDLSITTDLATDYRVSKDGLTWTVDIRKDARFTNGATVTADDVAYTFETAAESGGLTDVTALKEARAVDADTVELVLKSPQSTFVNRLISLGIVPKDAHGKEYASNPVGSGPFTLVDWQRGQQLVVERNKDYYGTAPAFDKVTFLFFDSEDSALAAAKAGEVDIVGVPSSLAVTEVEGMRIEAVTSVDNRGMSLPAVPNEGKRSESGVPIGNDVTSDVAVRRALNLAVDRQKLVDGVLEGYGSPAFGPADAAPWFQPTSAIEDNDIEGAKKLLQEAGWVDSDGDGIREKDGVKASINLVHPAGDSLRQGLALSVADMVKPIGIEFKVAGKSWDEIEKIKHTDAILFGWGSHDPTELYNLLYSKKAGTELLNPGFYSNPKVDAALDAALAANSEEEAIPHWRDAQLNAEGEGSAAAADAAWVWLVNLEHTYYVSDCLDIGTPQIEPHGHGWPLTAGIAGWKRTC